MANPRAIFNENVQAGKLKLEDFPEVKFKDGIWHAVKTIKGVRHDAARPTKTAAIDIILAKLNDSILEEWPQTMDVDSYCCDKKCFITPEWQVDGIACPICEAFSFCHCKCKSFYKLTWREKLSRANGTYSLTYQDFLGEFCVVKIKALKPTDKVGSEARFYLKGSFVRERKPLFNQEGFIDECIETFLSEL